MDKYIKALDYFKSLKTDFDKTECYILLERIANKSYPKKPAKVNIHYFEDDQSLFMAGKCRTCDADVFKEQHYCEKCGQMIDWRVEDELFLK